MAYNESLHPRGPGGRWTASASQVAASHKAEVATKHALATKHASAHHAAVVAHDVAGHMYYGRVPAASKARANYHWNQRDKHSNILSRLQVRAIKKDAQARIQAANVKAKAEYLLKGK